MKTLNDFTQPMTKTSEKQVKIVAKLIVISYLEYYVLFYSQRQTISSFVVQGLNSVIQFVL